MLNDNNRKSISGTAYPRAEKSLKKPFFTKEILAVSAIALVILSALIIAVASQIKISSAIIKDGSSRYEIYTSYNNLDQLVAEQKNKLHPFDMITYAGYNDDRDFEIVIERAPTVTISDSGKQITVRAKRGETVGSLFARENINLDPEDIVSPALNSIIDNDTEIAVTRALPVTLIADGTIRRIKSQDMTVSELLEKEEITVGPDDEVSVPLNMHIYENMEVFVSRVTYVSVTKTEVFPYQTKIQESTLSQIGTQRVLTKGVDGYSSVTTTDKYVNGIKLATYISDTSYSEPITEVIEVGTAKSVPISKKVGDFTLVDGIPTEYDYVVSGKVTAYTARSGCGTYSGRPLEIGSIAVVPDVIPFGSEVYIVSKDGTHVYGYAIASDTGDLKEANVVADVFMGLTEEHYRDACAWGAQFCDVYVLTTGDNSVSWRD